MKAVNEAGSRWSKPVERRSLPQNSLWGGSFVFQSQAWHFLFSGARG